MSDVGVARSGSLDSMHSSNGSSAIQKLNIFGELKDNERGHHYNCMVRTCHIRVARIEFPPETLRSKLPDSVTVALSMNRVRRMIRTGPIDLGAPASTPGEKPSPIMLDLCLGFHYVHSLKDYDNSNMCRIMLQQVIKKRPRVQYITLASASIDLTLMLQRGFSEEIVLRVPIAERSELAGLISSHTNNSNSNNSNNNSSNSTTAASSSSSSSLLSSPYMGNGNVPTGMTGHAGGGSTNSEPGQPYALLHATILSYPKEIESVEDAEDWDMMDLPLSDEDDGVFIDSDDELDNMADQQDDDYAPSANTTPAMSAATSSSIVVPSLQSSNAQPSPSASSPMMASPATNGYATLSQRLWDKQNEQIPMMTAAAKKSAKMTKLQKLSSFISNTPYIGKGRGKEKLDSNNSGNTDTDDLGGMDKNESIDEDDVVQNHHHHHAGGGGGGGGGGGKGKPAYPRSALRDAYELGSTSSDDDSEEYIDERIYSYYRPSSPRSGGHNNNNNSGSEAHHTMSPYVHSSSSSSNHTTNSANTPSSVVNPNINLVPSLSSQYISSLSTSSPNNPSDSPPRSPSYLTSSSASYYQHQHRAGGGLLDHSGDDILLPTTPIPSIYGGPEASLPIPIASGGQQNGAVLVAGVPSSPAGTPSLPSSLISAIHGVAISSPMAAQSPSSPSPVLKSKSRHPSSDSLFALSPDVELPTHIILVNASARRGRKLYDEIFRDPSSSSFSLNTAALAASSTLPTGADPTILSSSSSSSASSSSPPSDANKNMSSTHSKNPFKVIYTKSAADVSNILTAILTRYQQRSEPFRIGIAGSDSYINDVLRPLVDLLAKRPKGWIPATFYVIPIGRNNDLALHIASYDQVYKSLFCSPGWLEGFDITEPWQPEQVSEIERRIRLYMEEEQSAPYRFTIGEALLTYPGTAGKAIPFLKGLHIGEDPDDLQGNAGAGGAQGNLAGQSSAGASGSIGSTSSTLAPLTTSSSSSATSVTPSSGGSVSSMPVANVETELQVDYWVPKKKGDEEHHKVKSPLQSVAMTRLPAIATALRLESAYKPTPSTLSLLVQLKDKDKKGKVKPTMLTRAMGIVKDKKDKEKDKDGSHNSIGASVTKLICSSSNDNSVFRVVIDGVEWAGVKFVSVSPQWATHVKTFQVQAMSPVLMSVASPISPPYVTMPTPPRPQQQASSISLAVPSSSTPL
eukprot:TRINITY_DN4324_c0_g1_i1.p1 TRINITY_DN4324_c0_g1~~TRINITY_DN4324_c0_g1_i1.p1  ORF type:complete len:1193 (+),score=307.59 TRINITY_DN4324_c0_g1_i1:160-3738(+)